MDKGVGRRSGGVSRRGEQNRKKMKDGLCDDATGRLWHGETRRTRAPGRRVHESENSPAIELNGACSKWKNQLNKCTQIPMEQLTRK